MRNLIAFEVHIEVIGPNGYRDMRAGTFYVEEKLVPLLEAKTDKVVRINGEEFTNYKHD